MPALLRAATVAAALLSTAAQAEPLTLESAVARALNAAPQAAANAARIDALRAATRQAGVRPNPSIEVFGENLLLTSPNHAIDTAEVTVSYAQQIERGGKREARVALAEGEIGVAEAETLVQRLDIIAGVQRAYVEVEAAEAAIGVADERLRVATALASEVRRRVQSAKDPLFAGTRADTKVAEARVDLSLAMHARDAALVRLAALWGGSPEGLEISDAHFLRFERPRAAAPGAAPADLAAFEARARRADAAIKLEQAKRVQDPTVRGGVRYLRGSNDLALVGGFSIPLARHDTNRANVERAIAERRRADADIEVARVMRLREIRLAEEKVEESRHEAEAIRDLVVPGLVRTLAQVRDGYARGGFSYLDVAQAQEGLGAACARLIVAATEYHRAQADLDRLTARFANPLPLEQTR